MKKRALITGITGQDGSYLAEFLLKKGYEVYGVVRRSSQFNRERIDHFYQEDEANGFHLRYGDVTDPFSLLWILKEAKPDEVYNLAAQSHVGVSWETPFATAQVTALGTLNLLESIRVLGISPKVYHASTSELYAGDPSTAPQDEQTRFEPQSPYASAKLYAHSIAQNYRKAHKMFICCGILFNHESPRRGENFVTKKIVKGAVKDGKVTLGNLRAFRDWGHARDYVEAMWLMLQQQEPDDYVVATGETHSVQEFVDEVQKLTGAFPVYTDEKYCRPSEVHVLRGNPKKAQEKLKWKPKTNFKALVREMVEEEKRL
jgi:GDPmannose 4,6-dehydratase